MGQTAAWHFTYQDENRSFVNLGMYALGSQPVTGVGEPEAVPTLFVTSGVFRALRVNALIGRTFTLDDEALDAGGQRLVDKIQSLLEGIAPYSDERDHLAMALFGASEVLSVDQDGRIKIPESLCEHAGISSKATFVGLGDKFQIWEPDKFREQFSQGRKKLSEFKHLLGADHRSSGDTEGARER